MLDAFNKRLIVEVVDSLAAEFWANGVSKKSRGVLAEAVCKLISAAARSERWEQIEEFSAEFCGYWNQKLKEFGLGDDERLFSTYAEREAFKKKLEKQEGDEQ